MRHVVAPILLVVALASGQWLEATIEFADSAKPGSLCYNSVNNKVYCALKGLDSVAVIDGATHAVLSKIAVGPRPGELVYNPNSNKVYCGIQGVATNWDSLVAVIDAEADTVLALLRVDILPRAFVHNPVRNKVYCGCKYGSNVTVIDGYSDTVAAIVPASYQNLSVCYDAVHDQVYAASFTTDRVTVINCESDSNVASISLWRGEYPYDVCWNPASNTVYVACCGNDTAVVIDCATNSIVRALSVGVGPTRLCYNSIDGKMYCSGDSVTVFDARTHEKLTKLWVGAYTVDMLYSALTDLVYCSVYDTLDSVVTVIDGAADMVRGQITVGINPGSMTYNTVDRRLYVSNWLSGTVSVIRDSITMAIDERSEAQTADQRPPAFLAHGTLCVRSPSGGQLLSITGRKVAELRPGANDVLHLSPGVYFVREAQAQAQAQAVRKVVITR